MRVPCGPLGCTGQAGRLHHKWFLGPLTDPSFTTYNERESVNMPSFSKQQLHNVALRILQGAGVGADEAETVSAELAEANLVGHDSHGIIRLRQYVEFIEAGSTRPGALVKVFLVPALLATMFRLETMVYCFN